MRIRSDQAFFHITDDLSGRRDFSGMEKGSQVLCLLGSKTRKPGQICVVQWICVDELEWRENTPPANQQELDALRREPLRKRSLDILHNRLSADWYVKMWSGAAPADLHDPVLAEVWRERLAELDPKALQKQQVSDVLKSCLYDFRTELDLESPKCSFQTLLKTFTLSQLAALGEPQSAWLRSADVAQKADVLEWFLLSSALREPKDDYTDWLTGRAKDEAVVAKRILDRGEALSSAVRQWAFALANNGWLSQAHIERLATEDLSAAAILFVRLSLEAQRQVFAGWAESPDLLAAALSERPSLGPVIARLGALAIDLETDGERIWEIGCAQGDRAVRLHDENAGTDLAVALTDLSDRVSRASIVIGHNILAWDWPILAPRLALESAPLIWDTLLVQYLMEPQARSHALGGTHHAEADAKVTLALFVRQLEQLPTAFAARLLTGQFHSVGALLRSVAEALASAGSLARPAPKILQDRGYAPPRVLLLPDPSICDVNWVPGVAVVQVDPQQSLPFALRQIDATRLEAELTAEQSQNPFAQVLLAVARRAAAEDIALRRDMAPVWLVERFPDLCAAIDRSCVIPAIGEQICVSPLPDTAAWWAQVDGDVVRAALPDGPVLIVDRNTSADDATAQLAWKHPSSLLRFGGDAEGRWVYPDRPAQLLKLRGGWRCFRTVVVPKSLAVEAPFSVAPTSRPVVLTRQQPELHPGSGDQATYWAGVLQSFREATVVGGGVVPVLLLGSTACREMVDLLATALAEIGMGEICPSHRSRREHLIRAAQRGFGVVDVIDRWRDWQSLSAESGIALQPVVEALPVEEWYALSNAAAPPVSHGESEAAKSATPTAPPALATVSGATLLEALPGLIGQRLARWLERTGLGSSDRPALVIDPCADVVSHQLRAFVTMRPSTAPPLSAAQRAQLDVVFASIQITREQAPSDFASMEKFLVANWQPKAGSGGSAVTGFMPEQKLAMESICTRTSDVMVALPTGGGKSVLFQVPALCRGLRNRRLTLVLSPLKALMEDQVARLHEQGFAESVDFLSGDRPRFEIAEVLQGVLDHRIALLYVAPERMRSGVFVDVLNRRIESDGGLEYAVFDETHCVNQWGYEFRPDYFYAFKSLLGRLRSGDQPEVTPFLLLSATITASDRRNLRGMLTRGSKDGAALPLTICPDSKTFSNPLRSHIQIHPVLVQGNLLENQDFEGALAERLPRIVGVIREARRNREKTGQRSAVIVFVSRRAHAEEVAKRLADAVSCDVEAFHAGLDAATRKDIYSRFRDGQLDVLVATKAFGMGMDIPDIHWVVHISPPTYLEDYLQEVGRIGRGKNERDRAGLDSLSAVMLFSGSDFENMRGLRAKNELGAPQITYIEEKLVKNIQVIDGQKVVVVSENGYEPFKNASDMRAKATQLRMALHWLEKAEHLEQLGMVADLVTVDLLPAKLSEIGKEQSIEGSVARAIVLMAAAPADDRSGQSERLLSVGGDGVLRGLLSWLADRIGVRIDSPSKASSGGRVLAGGSKAIINLSQIRAQCQIKSMGDAMACLVDIQRRGGLTLNWVLEFSKRPMLLEPPKRLDALFVSIGEAVRKLIQSLNANGSSDFNPFDWLNEEDWGLPVLDPSNGAKTKEEKEHDALLKRYRRAFLHGFRSLARTSGVRLLQAVREESEGIVWQGFLGRAKIKSTLGRCDELLKMAQPLLPVFVRAADSGGGTVEVYGLIRKIQEAHPQKRFHEEDLKALLRLFSSMNLVSTHPQFLPMSYVLALGDLPVGLDAHDDLVAELNDVSELAEARNFAMEVFANLPDKARGDFISGYFAQANVKDLKGFLETELGDIEDSVEDLSNFIVGAREQLRATKATEFFDRYASSEEPAQWTAIQHPFNQHLLVNAGPGAGKTSVLVGRIAHLIREQHVKPSEIIVLAFNRDVVFEIKKRIRDLFKSLGYAAYVEQVRISTFHSLAIRSLYKADACDDLNRSEDVLAVFAAKLSSDQRFREQVAGGCHSILVDEYQDLTEDVYSIIRNLYLGSDSRAGVMVIGDDDQDILRWIRCKGGARGDGEFSEVFFGRFKAEFGGENLSLMDLEVNFRSGREIVNLSQKMISGFFEKHVISKRLKKTQLRESVGAAVDRCEGIDWRGKTWEETIDRVANVCTQLLTESPGSLAVLCRSNSEVAQIHHRLVAVFPGLVVQSGANMQIADLRHVGLWLDFIEIDMLAQDSVLTETLKKDLIGAFKKNVLIPETRSSDATDFDLSVLWDLCCEEHVFPHLSNLVRFLKSLKVDEFQRLGARQSATLMVVSTIHKVKGLEYDNVVVVPSKTPFGKQAASAVALEKDAAEEARLLYVAMTRAKSRLVYFMGDRECGWARVPSSTVAGEHGQSQILEGGHEEVGLGWSMQKGSYNPDPDVCQLYIEQEVRVGDSISLGGVGAGAYKGLVHRGQSGRPRQIGFLSKKSECGNGNADLKVSAVVRFRSDERDPDRVGKLVANRGWGYVVLVAGRLR